MMTKDEFFKAFQATMKGNLSTKEFARQAVEYFRSPDYQRWKAAHEAERLKAQKEGRARVFELMEEARKDGVSVDHETIPLKNGHDSFKVMIGGESVYFPSFLSREWVESKWNEFMENLKARSACGKPDCKVSTSIDDFTLTFGRGELSDSGFWEYPCKPCAAAYKKDHPEKSVWPTQDALKQG